MKVGLRTPSIKKSFKARTTGKYKRKLKRLVNPFYGKKGMGWIKNPSRALKNKIYHKTTFSAKQAGSLLYFLIVVPIKWMFIIMWVAVKWTAIAMFYMMKYMLLGMAWVFVALYNGIVSLVEIIINAGREEPPVNEIEDKNEPLCIENTTERISSNSENITQN